jgi:uncharacterized protein YgiB involved in biofilm formation
MKKIKLNLKKETLGRLSSSDMNAIFGGDKSDSSNTSFTNVYSCCHAGCPSKPQECETPEPELEP